MRAARLKRAALWAAVILVALLPGRSSRRI